MLPVFYVDVANSLYLSQRAGRGSGEVAP